MGMKKSAQLMGLIAMAAAMSGDFPITEERPTTSKPKKPIKPKEPIPFLKQEGVVKTIEDFKEIVSGTSKKGVRKQNAIVHKISDWTEQGWLTQDEVDKIIAEAKPR